jgi:hypothetical protein
MWSPTYFFEILSFISGLISLIVIIRKDPKYYPNRFAGIGIFLVGCHPFAIFLYDIIATDLAVQILLRVAICSSLIGITLIFFSILSLVNSVEWFKSHLYWLIFVIIDIVVVMYLIFVDFIEFGTSIVGNVNITMNLVPLAIDILLVLFYLFMSIYHLYYNGIKHVSNPKQRKKMKIFLFGLIFSLVGIFATIVSQIVSNEKIGVIFDIIFLAGLSLSSLIMMISFLK